MARKNAVYCDAAVGDKVRVTKDPSFTKGLEGVVNVVNRYQEQADWYLVDLGAGVFSGADTTMWFRASEVEKIEKV